MKTSRRAWTWAWMTMTLACALLSGVAYSQAPADLPDETAIAAARQVILDVFKDEFAKKTPADKLALARSLIEKAGDAGADAASRVAMLREAQSLAKGVSDLPAQFDAADGLGAWFPAQAMEAKVAALAVLSRGSGKPEQFSDALTMALDVLGQCIAEGHYEAAGKLLPVLDALSQRSMDAEMQAVVKVRTAETRSLLMEVARVRPAMEKLRTDPEDAAANTIVGRFDCFFREAWEAGLRRLAKGSDLALKAMAEKELAEPATGEARADLADAWWSQGEREAARVRPAIQRHALDWYSRALPDLTGMRRDNVIDRLARAPAVPPTSIPPRMPLTLAAGAERTFQLPRQDVTVWCGFSYDGRYLAVADLWSVTLIDLLGGPMRTIEVFAVKAGEGKVERRAMPVIHAVTFTPDGRRFLVSAGPRHVVGHGDRVLMFDLASGTLLGQFQAATALLSSPTWTPEGVILVQGIEVPANRVLAGTAVFWALPDGNVHIKFPVDGGARVLTATPSFTRVVTAAGREVRLYDVRMGRELLSYEGAPWGSRDIHLSRDGRVLAVRGELGLSLWYTPNPKPLCTPVSAQAAGLSGQARLSALSPDGRRVAVTFRDEVLRVYDTVSGRETQRITAEHVRGMAYSPDGRGLLLMAEMQLRLVGVSR